MFGDLGETRFEVSQVVLDAGLTKFQWQNSVGISGPLQNRQSTASSWQVEDRRTRDVQRKGRTPKEGRRAKVKVCEIP
jgi:hypothetical protein